MGRSNSCGAMEPSRARKEVRVPFSATVFKVLIASPSDVPDERVAIAKALHDWNSLHSEDHGQLLLPVMWETHSAPAMGDRPQAIINEQVVKSCDMLIGSFWTRLGSPTGVEESGTVEEVKWFLAQKKPVMLYYSKAPIDPDAIDMAQHAKLKEFKASIRDKGIQAEYRSVEELSAHLYRHLTIVMRDISVTPTITREVVKAVKASDDAAETEQPRGEIWFLDYSDKAFLICGDTKPVKEQIKDAGGRWMKSRDGTMGWVFPKSRVNEIARLLGISPAYRS